MASSVNKLESKYDSSVNFVVLDAEKPENAKYVCVCVCVCVCVPACVRVSDSNLALSVYRSSPKPHLAHLALSV
jgi:hypothetical protein